MYAIRSYYVDGHREQVVKACRAPIFDREGGHDEHDAVVPLERSLLETLRTQPFGARPLKKPQVVSVVDDSAAVGVV